MSGAEIKLVGVLGSGQMGQGIAQVAAQAGLEVILIDAAIDVKPGSDVNPINLGSKGVSRPGQKIGLSGLAVRRVGH